MRTRTFMASSLVVALGLLSGGAWGQGARHPDGDGVGAFNGFDPGRGVVRISETELPIAPATARALQLQLEGGRRAGVSAAKGRAVRARTVPAPAARARGWRSSWSRTASSRRSA